MPYYIRRVRTTVIVPMAVGSVLLAITVGLALTSHISGAVISGLLCMATYLVALAMVSMTPIKHRQRRVLAPGRTIRFRNRRYFVTSASIGSTIALAVPVGILGVEVGPWPIGVLLSALILGRVVFVFAVPPKGGRRSYEVTATELTIRTSEEHRVVAWREVEYLRHRPPASMQEGTFVVTHTTYHEYLELFLRDPGQRRYGGRQRPGAGLEVRRRRARREGDRRVVIYGVHRQSALSRLIIDQCRERIGRALRAGFDRVGELDYGEFRLTRDGVHAPDGFLHWRTDWQFFRSRWQGGIRLTIAAPDNQHINGWVPEEMIALDLLNTLDQAVTSR